MSKENKSTHEFDFQLICEYFSSLERQGPGSPDITKKALSFIEGLSENSRVADLGCGTGGQTLVLAENMPGSITGLDLFPEFIGIFNEEVKNRQIQERVKGIVGSMDDLPFKHEELDLIWAEGSIYNIGFEQGLRKWRQYLKPGAYVAVSEACWFTEERPEEISAFWEKSYAGIDTVSHKVAQLEKAGYIPVATFILPENCWIENFYQPQIAAQEKFLKKYAGNKTAEEFIASEKREAYLYHKYKQYYGYAFYIGKKQE